MSKNNSEDNSKNPDKIKNPMDIKESTEEWLTLEEALKEISGDTSFSLDDYKDYKTKMLNSFSNRGKKRMNKSLNATKNKVTSLPKELAMELAGEIYEKFIERKYFNQIQNQMNLLQQQQNLLNQQQMKVLNMGIRVKSYNDNNEEKSEDEDD